MHALRPPQQRGFPLAVQPIYAALSPLEPAINVLEQNSACLRRHGSEIAGTRRSLLQHGGTHESLLPVGRHNGLP